MKLRNLRENAKVARRSQKVFMRSQRIKECQEACDRGRVGEMYKLLRTIGRKNLKEPASVQITAEEFKEHFERVSKERYEVEPSVIRNAIEGVRDHRGDEKAIEANEFMNQDLSEEEIDCAIREMKESAPGLDGVRICYIKYACDDVRKAVIEMVQYMFEERANKWNESLKEGLCAHCLRRVIEKRKETIEESVCYQWGVGFWQGC